jgi:hypothetical protein
VVAVAAVAQLLQQYVFSPSVWCVEGSTIGLWQWAQVSTEDWPAEPSNSVAQFEQQNALPPRSTIVE